MKYWRGYLVAAIIAACSWGLMQFAEAHTLLVDMIYPYVSRMFVSYMVDWSSGVTFCVWQLVSAVLVAALLASIILMIVLHWNPIQWFGWVLTAVSILFLLHTGIYGLNYYAGPLADDVRLEVTEYTVSELEAATLYYRDQANALSQQVSRDSNNELQYPSFEELAQQAADGFRTLTYEEGMAVFAGSTVPVKELEKSKSYTSKGITGITVNMTGEAAVNPQTPSVILPYVICREMAHRMCIAIEPDAAFAAIMTCEANSSPEFQYAAYFMAYRYCYDILASLPTSAAQSAADKANNGVSKQMRHDMDTYDTFFRRTKGAETAGSGIKMQDTYLKGDNEVLTSNEVVDLLVSWHIQEIVLPQQAEEEALFNPLDETQVDLSGIVNAK